MSTPRTIDELPDGASARVSDLKAQFDALAWKLVRTESTWYARFGLTRIQAFTLHAVQEFGPDIDMATLVTITSLPPSSITSIVDRLVELGYVTRHRDERDRRRVTATITESGRVMVTRMEESNTRLLASMLDGIADADIATVTRVFRHMTDRLEHVSLDPPAP
jgi:DNA-binding MarR family transcriptional regulator